MDYVSQFSQESLPTEQALSPSWLLGILRIQVPLLKYHTGDDFQALQVDRTIGYSSPLAALHSSFWYY